MLDVTTLGPKLSAFLSEAGALAQVAPVGPAPAAPAGGAPSGSSSSGSGPGGGMLSLLFPLLIFVAFYFFLIRPQQKKAKDLDSKLKKGDKVITNSGLIGTIVTLGEKRATLEIAPGVKVELLRSAISGVDEGDAPKKPEADPKAAAAKK